MVECSIAPCPQKAEVKDVCRKHYARFRRTGLYGPGVGTVPRGRVRSFFPKQCRSCGIAKPLGEFQSTSVGTCKRCNGIKGICRKRGVSVETYYVLFALQGGRCAICISSFGDTQPDFDHNHNTGEPRGLLCGLCNMALLAIERCLDFGSNAAAYLLNTPFSKLHGFIQEGDFVRNRTNSGRINEIELAGRKQ